MSKVSRSVFQNTTMYHNTGNGRAAEVREQGASGFLVVFGSFVLNCRRDRFCPSTSTPSRWYKTEKGAHNAAKRYVRD